MDHDLDTRRELAPHELAAWRGMLVAHAGVTRELDSELRRVHGLSLSEYEVLLVLAGVPEHRLRMSEIADRVLLSRSGLTRLVDRLARIGHVTRCAAESDGRGLFAELTDAGLEAFMAARTTHLAGVRRTFLARLTVVDQMALADIWQRFAGTPGTGDPASRRAAA
jgi:DNA-binding MarR family transcriptional regulator